MIQLDDNTIVLARVKSYNACTGSSSAIMRDIRKEDEGGISHILGEYLTPEEIHEQIGNRITRQYLISFDRYNPQFDVGAALIEVHSPAEAWLVYKHDFNILHTALIEYIQVDIPVWTGRIVKETMNA